MGFYSVLKMFTKGLGSREDLIRRMQPRGDLQNTWIMFSHRRLVKDWSTMACHVYDPKYK